MDQIAEMTRVAVFVAIALVLPQVLGYAFYRWTRSRGKAFTAVAFLIPPIVFYSSASEFWGYQASKIRAAGHHLCGAFGAAATFSTFFGTLFHLVMGTLLLATVSFVWKQRAAKRAV